MFDLVYFLFDLFEKCNIFISNEIGLWKSDYFQYDLFLVRLSNEIYVWIRCEKRVISDLFSMS